jgi:signal peptidase I
MFGLTIRNALHAAIGLAIVALVLHTWLLMGLIVPVVVSGSSMAPTLRGPARVFGCQSCGLDFATWLDDDSAEPVGLCPQCGRMSDSIVADRRGARLLVDRTAFAFRRPRRWEVVVFRSPQNAGQLSVKRVAGLPGETISISGGDVYINGLRAGNPLGIRYETRYGGGAYDLGGWRLGGDEYFVVGDNASISVDSRSWVPKAGLDAKLLIGKPLGVR